MGQGKVFSYFKESAGFWGWYTVGYWVSFLSSSMNGDLWWLNQFGFSGVACVLIALAFVLARRKGRAFPTVLLDRVSLVLALCALLVLGLYTYVPINPSLLVVVIACVGFYIAWSVIRWGSYYASFDAHSNLVRTLCGIIAVSVIKMIFFLSPTLIKLVLVGVVLVCTTRFLPAQTLQTTLVFPQQSQYNFKTILSLWQTILSIIIFLALWSFLDILFVINIGHIAHEVSFSSYRFSLTQVVDISFALVMLWWVEKRKHMMDWTLFWQVAFFYLAVGLLSITMLDTTLVAQVFVSAAAELVFTFQMYFLVHLGRKSAYPPCVIMGAGFALVFLVNWSVRSAAMFYRVGIEEATFVPYFLFLILLTLVFLLPARSPGMQMLTLEPEDQRRSAEGSNNERCSELGAEFGLSAREVEVMRLLAQGRSTPYIAETLYLSKNTVKTYNQHIYRKLGVHNKQELIDLVNHEAMA